MADLKQDSDMVFRFLEEWFAQIKFLVING